MWKIVSIILFPIVIVLGGIAGYFLLGDLGFPLGMLIAFAVIVLIIGLIAYFRYKK
jgi:hypothetical protein